MTNAESKFVEKYPCMYMKAILCINCTRTDCDMKEGREIQKEFFINGYLAHKLKMKGEI